MDRCDHCGSELRPLTRKMRTPRRFCSGNRCRSAWHNERKRRLLGELDARISGVYQSLSDLRVLVDELLGARR